MSGAEIKVFSPHLYNHHMGLQRQLSSHQALLEMEPTAATLPHGRYFSRWQILWITIKYPFEMMASVFFKAISFILTQLSLHKSARFFSVLSVQMTRDWHQVCTQWFFRDAKEYASSPLLMPAFNAHQTSSWDLYMHGAIARSFLIDKEIISMTSYYANYHAGIKKAFQVFYSHLNKVEQKQRRWYHFAFFSKGYTQAEKVRIKRTFTENYAKSPMDSLSYLKSKYDVKGIDKALEKLYDVMMQVDGYLAKNCNEIKLFSPKLCRGASMWFINLCLKSADRFHDPLQHLLAVSKLFKNGIPKQGAILQSLESLDKMLKLKKEKLKEQHISLYELDCDQDLALAKIESLDKGFYRVGVLNHSLVYVKTENGDYVWDPENGLFASSDKQLFNYILDHYYQPGNRHSQIYFEKYEL